MFIRSKITSKFSIFTIFILATLLFSFTSLLSAKDSITDSLPPFNPEPTTSLKDSKNLSTTSSSDSSLDKTLDTNKVKKEPKEVNSSLPSDTSTLDSTVEPTTKETGELKEETQKHTSNKVSENKKDKQDDSKKEALTNEKTPTPTPVPFKVDPASTLISFQLDLLGLATFISVDSNSLVRTISSGFTLFYKLRPLSSSSVLLLNLGYRAFTTYTKDDNVDFDLTTHHYFAGSSYKQEIIGGFSISSGINLGIATLKKFYIDSGKQTKITFTPGVMANFQYDFTYIQNLSAGLKVEYNFGKLSFFQNSLYVGLNF